MITATKLRPGMIILFNEELFRVETVHHVTPGNWRGMVQTKLKNVKTGRNMENRFSPEDKVDKATLEEHDMEYIYSEGNVYNFMNVENFEQIGVQADILGDAINYIIPNCKFKFQFYEGAPLGVELPQTVRLKVVETEPKRSTAGNATKLAKLETGISVQVPMFIETGDILVIDTSEGRYLERG
jgi:elongation factor P